MKKYITTTNDAASLLSLQLLFIHISVAYGVAKPQQGLTGVASHFRSALPLGSSKNGWVKEEERLRAFRYATICSCVSRTYGTPVAPTIGAPAIEMAGYLCLMPMASWATKMCIKSSFF